MPDDLTALVAEQMPLAATLGIRTSGGPDELEMTLAWRPELSTMQTQAELPEAC